MSDRLYSPAPRVGVGIVILLNGKLLLVKRKNKPAMNMWTLPGGMVELGERVEDAVKREALEELGLRIEVDHLLDIVDFIEKDHGGVIRYHYVLLDYLTYATGGNLQPGSDVSEIRLVNPDVLPQIDLPKITKSFFDKHLGEILGHCSGR